MLEPIQKASNDFQKVSKENYEAVLRSYGELNKGFQAIATRVADYSKKAFETCYPRLRAAGRRKVI